MTDLLSNQYVSMGIGLALSVISMNPMFGLSQLEMSLLVTTAYKGAVTAITGGDMQAVLQAVAMNMFSTLTWGATGSGLEAAGMGSGTGHWFGRGVVHGVVGGGLSEVQGGDFQDGFLAAATSEMVGDYFGPLTKDNYDTAEIGKRTAAAAIIGGTAAAITGGDFVNGAQTAAYAQLYNAIKDYLDDINAALVPLPDGGAEAALAIDETAEGTIAVGEILEEDFQSLEYAGGVVDQAFELAPRVLDQINDSRLGKLAGRLNVDNLNLLANAPKATRVYDMNSGYINVIQNIEGKLLRITVPSDSFRIISVGPIRLRNVINSIASGRYVLLK